MKPHIPKRGVFAAPRAGVVEGEIAHIVAHVVREFDRKGQLPQRVVYVLERQIRRVAVRAIADGAYRRITKTLGAFASPKWSAISGCRARPIFESVVPTDM